MTAIRTLPLLLLAVAACDRGGPEVRAAAPEPPPATTAAKAAAASAGALAAAPAVATPAPGTSIAEQLQREAAGRPAIPLRAEQVLAALQGAGIHLDTPRQVIGLTVRASYCLAASGSAGLGVAVCEYPDDAAAAAGQQYSIDRFGAMQPNRRIERKGALTLTLTVPPSADGDAAARAAIGSLARL
jgi:hypothetical protein